MNERTKHSIFSIARASAMLCALVVAGSISGCRAPVPSTAGQAACGPMDGGYAQAGVYGGYDQAGMYGGGFAPAPPLPYDVANSNWAPEGIARPWPENEYLRDGGDQAAGVAVAPDWTVYGLDVEDTVAHYDSIDGRTHVEPSNKVNVYAPRFCSVRTVRAAIANEATDPAVGVELPVRLARHDDNKAANTSLQLERAMREELARLPGSYDTRQFAGAISTALTPVGFDNAYKAYENMQVIRLGVYLNSEAPWLAIGHQAAVTWTGDLKPQVVLDGKAAQAVTKDAKAEEIYTVKDLRSPKLRLIKVASTQTAQPGDVIEFTLRFDNVGEQPLGNIVILDNLTTRLEYIEGSAESSVESEFSHTPNAAQSSVLRWEIDQPLEPGEGGVLRFDCKVR